MFYTEVELLTAGAQVWPALRTEGMPLYDRDRHRATFVFQAPASTTQGVHLWINRLSDKQHYEAGVMRQVPGTELWVRTMDIPPRFIGSYCFRINGKGDSRPEHNEYPFARDLHNPEQVVIDGHRGLSLVRGAGREVAAPWASIDFGADSRVARSLVGDYPVRWYLPTHPAENLPVLVLFDADVWFDRIGLGTVLDVAITKGIIRPFAVAGVGFVDSAQRRSTLGAISDTHEFLRRRVVPELAAYATGHGCGLGDEVFIAGQSLGGLQALRLGLNYPEHYRGLSVCSPSMWWHPGADASPADLARQSVPWIVKAIATARPGEYPSCLLHVGAQEGLLVAHAHGLSHALGHARWPHSLRVEQGGHDVAWWREALVGDLMELMGPGEDTNG